MSLLKSSLAINSLSKMPLANSQAQLHSINIFDANTNVNSIANRVPNTQRPFIPHEQSKGWIINISAGYKFATSGTHQVQISYNQYIRPLLNQKVKDYSQIAQILVSKQFEILCRLLQTNTCQVIYFDAAFSDEQLARIRVLQSASTSELVNTRMAYLFNQKKHA